MEACTGYCCSKEAAHAPSDQCTLQGAFIQSCEGLCTLSRSSLKRQCAQLDFMGFRTATLLKVTARDHEPRRSVHTRDAGEARDAGVECSLYTQCFFTAF
eukprot:scaffold39060_cov20-Tisochrysis_lutea.AAC.1